MKKKNITEQFLETTPKWAVQLKWDDLTKPCICCGVIPANMLELVEGVKKLQEKAWKYDALE